MLRHLVSSLNEAKREADAFAMVSDVQRRLGDGSIVEHPCRRYARPNQTMAFTWASYHGLLIGHTVLQVRVRGRGTGAAARRAVGAD